MKILFINGSPHKGNTWKLAQTVKVDLLKKDSSTIIEEIHLNELNLPFCCGCSNCFRIGHEKCPHYNIISKIINSIDDADGVVFVSTTFNMLETSLLKNLFDHMCFMMHRPYFFSSKALILTTTGGVGGMAAAKHIAGTLKAFGFNFCYLFSAKSLSWNDYKPTQKTLSSLHIIASKFHNDISSKKQHSPSSGVLIPYNLFRGMCINCAKGTEYETLDGVYWAEETRKKLVYDSSVRVPFYKKPIGYLFYTIGKLAGKSAIITYKK